MSKYNKKLNKGRVTVVFQKKRTGKLWAKSYRTKKSAERAFIGVTSKSANNGVGMTSSKGFKLKTLKSWNKKRPNPNVVARVLRSKNRKLSRWKR